MVCIVFAKPPRPGTAKTRLAPALGPHTAADVARTLLADTWAALRTVDDLTLVLSTPEPHADHGLGEVETWDQGRGDLGARVERMLRRGIAEHGTALAVGADAPGIPLPRHLEAVEHLEQGHPAVLGPSEDGGFYLLGLRDCPEGLLADLPWSQPTTGQATEERLTARGLTPLRLAPGWDVDELADLLRLREEVPRARAPHTHALLDELGWS